jgi:hydrophobe/amphiphile efflux-3 (HAE3) family protein
MKIAHSLAKILVKRPKTVLLVYTIITIVIGLQIRNLYMESDLTQYLPQNDPTFQLWDRIDHEFQIGSTIIVYVNADDIRDPYILREMDRVTTKINTYELDKGKTDGIFSVSSIAQLIKEENAKPNLPEGLGGTGKYDIPDDPALITTYIARIQSMESILFLNTYKDAVIVFQLAENVSYSTILENVKAAIEKDAQYSDMTLTGGIAMQEAMRAQTLHSLNIVFLLAFVFVIINMFLFHRNVKSFAIGLIPLGYSLVLTFGILGTVQPQLTILSIAAAALLIGLGDDYSVYYANRFTEECSIQNKIERVECTLRRTGKAVLMCAVATMIGFGSLMTSYMPPMVSFGFVCLLGTALVFLSATILVPCLCLILNYEKHEPNHQWKRFAHLVVNQRKRLFVIGCFFVILSLLVLPQVKTDVNFIEMAPKGIPEVEKLLEYSQKFGKGANFNAILIETDSQGLTYPEVIDGIYSLELQIRAAGGSAYSIADEIKKINDILDRSVIVEKIANFVGIDQIILDKVAKKGLVDKDYSKTLILVSFPAETSIEQLEKSITQINEITQQTYLPYNGHASQLAGQDVVTVEVNKQIMGTQTSSLTTELLLILACLIIGFGSVRIGFLSLIPVLFVIAWEPGALVMFGIPLSLINVTIASIIVSSGIDYGIVITQRIKEEREKGFSKIDAMKTTIETSGWAILTASTTTMVALLATFAVNIPVLHQFSIVVITLYSFSVIAAFCIIPTVYASKWIK